MQCEIAGLVRSQWSFCFFACMHAGMSSFMWTCVHALNARVRGFVVQVQVQLGSADASCKVASSLTTCPMLSCGLLGSCPGSRVGHVWGGP